MGKTDVNKIARSPSEVPTSDGIEKFGQTMSARRLFYGSALDMGWQLAFAVLVPVIIGAKLDDHFHTAPSWTLTSLFVAIFGASSVVYKTLKVLSRKQLRNVKGRK